MSTREELRTGRRVRNGKVQVLVPADPPAPSYGNDSQPFTAVGAMMRTADLRAQIERLDALLRVGANNVGASNGISNVCFDLAEAGEALRSALEELTR